jgi:uncharacterized spore protein YtfJ
VTHEELLARAEEGLHAGRSFGPVIERDDCLIVPVAVTVGGGGWGDAPGDQGTSSGGGYGVVSWPLGVYVVRDGTVRWRPAVDATVVVLAVLTVMRALLRALKRR